MLSRAIEVPNISGHLPNVLPKDITIQPHRCDPDSFYALDHANCGRAHDTSTAPVVESQYPECREGTE